MDNRFRRIIAPGQSVAYIAIALYSRQNDRYVTYADDSGEFYFDNLPYSTYTLSAGCLDMFWKTIRMVMVPRYYRAGDHAVLSFVKGGVVTGTVTDENGDPVVGITVSANRIMGMPMESRV